jgi:2-C-methyl-D-erythritol 4-phosphate cytidylyltransferase
MNIAVILAGGVGSRLGYEFPKQFFKVAGKSVIEHTIDVFENNQLIDEIAVVVHAAYTSTVETMVLNNGWKKVRKILKGGVERYESSLAAISAYEDDLNHNLIFHDAVRPMLSQHILNSVVAALEKYNAVDVAVPSTDTIIKVDESGELIESVPNRKYLMRGQTPQAFKLHTIKKAYEIALQDPEFSSSDDCGTVVKYLPNEKVFVVAGEEANMKLTYKEDTYLLDKLFQLRSANLHTKVDYHLLKGKVIVIFGGSSGIGQKIAEIAQEYGAQVFSFSRKCSQTDIADKNSVKEALQKVYNITQRIDYVVNTAAILKKEPLMNMKQSTIEQMIRTNYDGMINVAIESYPYLKESKGQLLLYTSSSYTRGRAFYSIYSSTKAAAVNFTQALAQEWEPAEIKVNVINPERTKTPMRVMNFGNEPDSTLLSSEEVAEVSLQTLLSDFTGQVIDIKLRKTNS